MAFAASMATIPGRLIRVGFGIVLILVGLAFIGGLAGWIIAAVGGALIGLGLFNMCVIALLIGAPFSGREALRRQQQTSL